MVTPEWPPITGTLTDLTSNFWDSATNVLALTTSNVLTPMILKVINSNEQPLYVMDLHV